MLPTGTCDHERQLHQSRCREEARQTNYLCRMAKRSKKPQRGADVMRNRRRVLQSSQPLARIHEQTRVLSSMVAARRRSSPRAADGQNAARLERQSEDARREAECYEVQQEAISDTESDGPEDERQGPVIDVQLTAEEIASYNSPAVSQGEKPSSRPSGRACVLIHSDNI